LRCAIQALRSAGVNMPSLLIGLVRISVGLELIACELTVFVGIYRVKIFAQQRIRRGLLARDQLVFAGVFDKKIIKSLLLNQ
jgi:hypothetical protein